MQLFFCKIGCVLQYCRSGGLSRGGKALISKNVLNQYFSEVENVRPQKKLGPTRISLQS
jgi:hypothetical protein